MHVAIPEDAAPKIRTALLKALELDNTSAEVHNAFAIMRTWTDWDWEAAESAFLRALEINPNYPDALTAYSHFLRIMGRDEEAFAASERAVELDPSDVMIQSMHAGALSNVGRYDEAIALYREMLQITPNSGMGLHGLVGVYHKMGMQDEAVQAQKAVATLRGNDPEFAEQLGRIYAEAGYRAVWKAVAEKQAALSIRPVHVAEVYVRAGEKELALDWLEKAFERRDPNMSGIGGVSKRDMLRDEPRYQDLLDRMNIPPDHPARSGAPVP